MEQKQWAGVFTAITTPFAKDLSVDHVFPYVRGGRTDLSNGAIAHKVCNSGKGASVRPAARSGRRRG